MPRRHRVPIEEILFRTLLLWLINVIALVLAAALLPGVYVTSLGGAALFMGIIGVINALLWPLLARVTLPFMVLTLGLFSIVLSGGLFYLVGRVVDGVTFTNYVAATVTAVVVGVVNALAASLLTIDDDAAFLRGSIQRTMRRMTDTGPRKHYPGVILLEVDGCSEAIFRHALDSGLMPTMARWLADGTHRIISWETDLSCQTGAAQAGILHGSNHNIPAFRWVEKSLGNRVVSSNGPKDSPLIEQRINNGEGLLSIEGAARINLFSGNAADDLLVYSTLTSLAQVYKPSYYVFFSNPYNFVRTLTLTLVDVVHEWRERRRQIRENIWPRIPEHRTGVYPFVRAATTVLLRDMSVYTLIGDIFAGAADVIYATFYAYDEVAHHSGVDDRDALAVLSQLDKAFARVARAVEEAERPYQIVVLSDHGQSKGATFKQRYGMTLKDLVAALLPGGLKTYQELSTDEGWGHVGALMTEAAQTNTRVVSKTVRRMSRQRMRDGEVLVGPDYKHERALRAGKSITVSEADLIVLASGNLGLIYFTAWQARLTLEQIDEFFPDLIGGMVAHPGIGFVMVHSEASGPLAIGAHGVYYLAEGRFTGENPLANFRPGLAEHLCRTDTFDNAPDILVNSFYDPTLDEGAAFEELIGFHGGAGGNQSHPFLFVPSAWTIDADGPIVGAEQVHRALKRQLVRLRRGSAANGEPEAQPVMPDSPVA